MCPSPTAFGSLLVALCSLLTVLARESRADVLEWSQKSGGAGAAISASGPYNASNGGTYLLHSAVGQASTVTNATDGATYRLNSQYLQTFPPRPLTQCVNEDSVNCTTWQNPTAVQNFSFRNDRGCASDCRFSKGALHYYRYVWSLNATESDANLDAGTKWSETGNPGWCPGGACDKYSSLGVPATQSIASEGNWYLHVRTYNGGLIGGFQRYGPFGVDRTNPSTAWSAPAAADWFRTIFNANVVDSDPTSGGVASGVLSCDVRVLSNGVYTVNDATWTLTNNRTCNSAASYSVTVGAAANCRDRGPNKCEVQVRARDNAGNLNTSVSRTFGIDWLLSEIHNNVAGNVRGYPASASDQSGTYIGTYVSANDSGTSRVYLTSVSDDCVSASYTLPDGTATCGSADCGDLVAQPLWSFETTNDYVYVGTTEGWIFKLQNSATGQPDCSTGTNELSLVSGWPIQIPNKCGVSTRRVNTPLFPDDKLVYFGAVDPDCVAGSKNYIFAYEITPTSYDADAGSDGIPDKIVDISGSGDNIASTPSAQGTWSPGPRYLHIGSDNSTGELYRVRVDIGAPPIGVVDCQRNVAGTITAWITGFAQKLYFGTLGGASARFYVVQNTETIALCSPTSPDAYSDLAGFPYTPAGGADIPRGAIVDFPSPGDEIYFVDDSGRLYCVCQTTSAAGQGCPGGPGTNCKDSTDTDAFPVPLESVALREPLRVDGTLYVASNTGRVYAVETVYDPACAGLNCDATQPGTVKTADGYSTTATTFYFGVTITSMPALRNNGGTKKIAVGTDLGKVFYLPTTP